MYLLIAIVAILILVGVVYLLSLFPFGLWLKCKTNQAHVAPMQLIAMQLRKVPTGLLVGFYIRARQAGVDVSLERLEVHYLTGGDVAAVVDALISADKANIGLTFEKAAAIDLAGRDVNGAVRMSVQPKVMKTVDIHGVAKDGIELIVRAKVTVRANLNTMVGGSGEETIMARVGEGIVSSIGSAATHSEILNRPEILTRKIIEAGLDSGSAYEIVSLDIADIDVGRNIGAHLKNTQAGADKKVAEARAEGRRALAMAQTQENKAMEAEARAGLIGAEMLVPQALAATYRLGKIVVKRKPRKVKNSDSGTAGLGFGDDAG